MIIAPWTKDDGDPIPDGKHIALTHWSIHQPTYDPEIFRHRTFSRTARASTATRSRVMHSTPS